LLDVAALYRHIGEPARCLTTLHQLLDTYPPGEEPQQALALEGQTLFDLGRPREAVASLLAAGRRGPPNAEILFLLAQVYASEGSDEYAATAARQALAVDAAHVPSRELLAHLADRAELTAPLTR
jgi:cytochrome c-type biogenesis protein CcmH/NrfG